MESVQMTNRLPTVDTDPLSPTLFRRCALVAIVLQVFTATDLYADGFLDFLRSVDLNEYALGVFAYTSSSHYEGIDDNKGFYPAPTRFGSAITSDDTFFVRDGDIGLRKQFASGWDLGAVTSIQTLGYGSGESPALARMNRRDWTVQAGATIGGHIGGFRIDAVAQTDILGEHSGQEYTFKIAKAFEKENFYLVPQFDVLYQSDDLVNHYFGVTSSEALPGRPAYQPGAAVTYSASLEWGWRWHRHWYVFANANIERVPTEIRNSPVVEDNDYAWGLTLGVGYDAPAFVGLQSDRKRDRETSLELGVGVFFANSDAKMFLTSGTAIVPIDLESDLSLDDSEVSVPVDLVWRFGPFHRLEFGYFQLKRSGVNDLVVPVTVGDITFSANETVQSSFDTTVYKLGYAFSLLHDSQKELSLFGGVHITDVSYRSADGTQTVAADTTAILPILGADLTVNFTDRLSLDAELQFFSMDFNRYSGSLMNFGFSGQYRLLDKLSVGVGYKYYKQDIDSGDEDFFGNYRFEYRGPVVNVRVRF